MTADAPVTVVIVDDHELVAKGLASLLEELDDVEVVGMADSVKLAMDRVAGLLPQVVLMDYRLGDGDGVQATREIRARFPQINVVMLTGNTEQTVLAAALDAGCCGFLDKNAPLEDLAKAVIAAADGESYFSRDILNKLVRLRRTPAAALPAELSDREREVLQMAADGSSPKEIALGLHVSIHTVRNHLRHTMEKLDAHTKLEAVVAAARLGLITISRD
jgi:DNA-binding NarL/FixJ family response regulator